MRGKITSIKLCNRQDLYSEPFMRIQYSLNNVWLKLFQNKDAIDRALFRHDTLWPFLKALSTSRLHGLPFLPHVEGKSGIYNSESILNGNQLWMTRAWEYPWCLQQAKLAKGMSVMDMGCGHSLFPLYLSSTGITVIGCDNDIRECELTAPTLAKILGLPIRYLYGDCANPPLGNYDVVFCISVLEHLPRQDFIPAIGNLLKEVKIGGKLIMTLDYGNDKESPESLHYQDLVPLLTMFNYKGDIPKFAHAEIQEMRQLWTEFFPFTKLISPSAALGITIEKI